MRAPKRPATSAACLLLLLSLELGCSTTRTFTIYSTPGDAKLIVDGVDRGPGPITQRFTFSGSGDSVRVRAVRDGYRPAIQTLSAETPGQVVVLKLDPLGPKAVVSVQPAALLRVDGRLVSTSPVTQAEIPLDASRPDRSYTITAEAPGYAREQRVIRSADPQGYYRIALKPLRPQETTVARNDNARSSPTTRQAPPPSPPPATRPTPVARADVPLRRTITIRTDPPIQGAEIFIAGEKRGDREVELTNHPFERDPDTGRSVPQAITATAPGFLGGEMTMRYEDNTAVYVIPLGDRRKGIRVSTDPPGAIVTMDGRELPRDREGVSSATLTFPPTDPPGQSTKFTATAKAGDPSAPYESAQLAIGWDEGRRDYSVRLPPSLVVKVPMVRIVPAWEQQTGWRATAGRVDTLGTRDPSEGTGGPVVHPVAELPADAMPDSIIASPDGSQVLITELLAPDGAGPLRSRLRLLNSDGSPGPALPSDGRHFDAMPSFTPDGGEILFTSDRSGQGLDVWSMKTADGGAVRQVARGGEKAGLWPMIDASPRRRLFYEAMLKPLSRPSEGRSEVHVVELEAEPPTNKALSPGTRPRASPRADAVLFTRADPATGKRDIYMISDKEGMSLGSAPVNLTNTPDVDDCDPAWSRTGGKIAYASDASSDPATGRNYDLYVLTVSDLKQNVRVTRNGSRDDNPAWDPTGKALYFRSNRGGKWGVWKVEVP